MSNKRKTRMTAAELQQLREDWKRAEWLERLAIGELTTDPLSAALQSPETHKRIAALPDATITLNGRER
jgi:hypothetical protein